jgi:hypothetical protein
MNEFISISYNSVNQTLIAKKDQQERIYIMKHHATGGLASHKQPAAAAVFDRQQLIISRLCWCVTE